GRALARRAKGFDMAIKYWNRTRLSEQQEFEMGLEYLPMDVLLQTADFVSLHLAFTPETAHLIGTRELEMMKPGSILINTARGPIVDEKALVRALKEGKIRGAGLDGFEYEPQMEAELI